MTSHSKSSLAVSSALTRALLSVLLILGGTRYALAQRDQAQGDQAQGDQAQKTPQETAPSAESGGAPATAASEAAASSVSSPSASSPTRVAPRRTTATRYKRQSMDDRIAVMSKNLALTENQRSAVKRILLWRQQEMLRIRNSDASGGIRIGQVRTLQDQTVERIRSVLNDEQKKKYDPLAVRNAPTPDTPQRSLEDWIKATTPH